MSKEIKETEKEITKPTVESKLQEYTKQREEVVKAIQTCENQLVTLRRQADALEGAIVALTEVK